MVVWERQMVEPAWRAGGGKICRGVVDMGLPAEPRDGIRRRISRRVIHSC